MIAPISSTQNEQQKDASVAVNKDVSPEKSSQTATPEKVGEYPDIPIVGRFDKHRSSYWAGLVAAVGMRYLPRPWLRPHFDIKTPTDKAYWDKHKYSAFAGSILTGVAGLYLVKTYADIKSILAEPVGWEKGKDPKDVNFVDLWTSKNSIVQQTMGNFAKFNTRRFLVNSVYFSPFVFKKYFKQKNFTGESGIDFGVASNATYLFHDILKRKMTPFEELQSLIDRKINHAEHFSDMFVATDLLDIYERHAEKDNSKSFMSQRGSPEWDQSMALFKRMADLMNQSYYNEVPHEPAQFGFSKFITLLGNHLIDPDNIEKSMAYVEIVNRYGVKELFRASDELENQGKPLAEVMKRYPEANIPATETLIPEPQTNLLPDPPHRRYLRKDKNLEGFASREEARSSNPDPNPQINI